jgi:IS5 family transposase
MRRHSKKKGQKPVSIRVALGARIIQQHQNFTDRETVEQISETPYLQSYWVYELSRS